MEKVTVKLVSGGLNYLPKIKSGIGTFAKFMPSKQNESLIFDILEKGALVSCRLQDAGF